MHFDKFFNHLIQLNLNALKSGAEPKGVERGHLPPLAPPKKSVNIYLLASLNAF